MLFLQYFWVNKLNYPLSTTAVGMLAQLRWELQIVPRPKLRAEHSTIFTLNRVCWFKAFELKIKTSNCPVELRSGSVKVYRPSFSAEIASGD